VTVSFSPDGSRYAPAQSAGLDEAGAARRNGETYGAVLVTGAPARFARITTDRPLGRVDVLAMRDGERVVRTVRVTRSAAAAVTAPSVVGRAGWGADESLRFDATSRSRS
jgi:hypothetical protein